MRTIDSTYRILGIGSPIPVFPISETMPLVNWGRFERGLDLEQVDISCLICIRVHKLYVFEISRTLIVLARRTLRGRAAVCTQ